MQGKRRRTDRRTLSRGKWDEGSDHSVFGEDGMGTSYLSDSGLAAVGESFVKLEKFEPYMVF